MQLQQWTEPGAAVLLTQRLSTVLLLAAYLSWSLCGGFSLKSAFLPALLLLLLLLPPMASGRAGISCRFQAGDTQLRQHPICHPQGHLPLASSPSAARHRHENPPT